MNKKYKVAVLLIIIILAVTAIAYYSFNLFSATNSSVVSNNVATSATSTINPVIKVPNNSQATTAASSTSINVPVDPTAGMLTGIPADNGSTFTNSVTKNSVMLTPQPDGGQNPGYDVLLNGTKVGEFSGYLVSVPAFSPNNAYLAFRFDNVCGVSCAALSINVTDITSKKVIDIQTPRQMNNPGQNIGPRDIVNPFIESYSWNSDSTINLVSYFVKTNYNDIAKTVVYDRISAREVWNYNLVTGKYTLVQTLPE